MTNPSGRGLAIAHIMKPGCINFIGNGNEVEIVYKKEEPIEDKLNLRA